MNKKVLVAGVAVAALVAGGLYFGPGNGGQGFIFRIPQREPVIVEKPNINLGEQDITGKNFQIRNGVGYEGQGRGAATNDDAVATRKPVNLDARNDFSINPDAMYQGDGQKRTPEASPNPFNDSGKKTKPVLGSGGSRGGSAPAEPAVEEPTEEESAVDPMADFAARKAAQHQVVLDKLATFRGLTWQYQSGVTALANRNCVDLENSRALTNIANDLADTAERMHERMGYVSRGFIEYRHNLGTDIDDAKAYLLGFGRVLDIVPDGCLTGQQWATFFPQAYLDDVNYGMSLGEAKDAYEYMMNNALY